MRFFLIGLLLAVTAGAWAQDTQLVNPEAVKVNLTAEPYRVLAMRVNAPVKSGIVYTLRVDGPSSKTWRVPLAINGTGRATVAVNTGLLAAKDYSLTVFASDGNTTQTVTQAQVRTRDCLELVGQIGPDPTVWKAYVDAMTWTQAKKDSFLKQVREISDYAYNAKAAEAETEIQKRNEAATGAISQE